MSNWKSVNNIINACDVLTILIWAKIIVLLNSGNSYISTLYLPFLEWILFIFIPVYWIFFFKYT